jgi:hypothetical protein
MDALIIAGVIGLLVVLAFPTIRDLAGQLRTNEEMWDSRSD